MASKIWVSVRVIQVCQAFLASLKYNDIYFALITFLKTTTLNYINENL